MRSAVAIDEMLDFSRGRLTMRVCGQEMALAVARIVGGEKEYIWLWRELKHDKNTAAAQALLTMKEGILFCCLKTAATLRQ